MIADRSLKEPQPTGMDPRGAIKRLTDVMIATTTLILLSPLFVCTVLAIKLTSRGPILYRWPVVGRGGRSLRAYKFRTMVVGADKLKEQLLNQNEATGPVFKIRNDPRVTRVGRFLRKFSLDELPQLWSIAKGDMSLVGPRPVLECEWAEFSEWQRTKLSIKPGAVCLWHVRGQPRNCDEWVKLDLEYINNWSLWLDLKILVSSLVYILSGRNY